ncbi:MAG: LysR family transcriptional regulator [Candidatus Caldarchaeum sp.]
MRIETLKLFCDVARRRSFSKAAEVNGISQSAVSQIIARLEQQLRVQLIDRASRPLKLRPAGKVFYTGCRKLLKDFRELKQSLAAHVNRNANRAT